MNIVERVKNILLSPATEWPVIERETHTVRDLYLSYLIPLAGLSALASLIGGMLWGVSAGPVTMRFSFFDALSMALIGMVLGLISVWIVAWLISALAPTFKGEKNFDRAFTVAAFAMTGALVGGMAAILPALAWLLGVLGSLYSLYLLYKGLPILMKSPPEKALGYTVVVVRLAIICNVVLAALLTRLSPTPWNSVGADRGSGGTEVTIRTPGGSVTTTEGKIEEMGRKLEQAARQAEQASQQQDPAGVSKAATDAMAAITGAVPGGNRIALASDTLKAWLPDRMAGLARESFDVQGGAAMGIAGSTAKATYRDGERRIELEVLDAGGVAGILSMISALQVGERETDTTIEKSYQADKRRITEKRWKNGERSELTVVLANGVMVTARARGVGFPTLDSAVRSLGLEKLESAQPAIPNKG